MTPRTLIQTLLNPQHVAIVGATDRTQAWRSTLWRHATEHTSPVTLWPVNPRYKYLEDTPCWPNLKEVPATIDVAVIAADIEDIENILADCGARQIPWAVLIADPNEASLAYARQEHLKALAESMGVHLIGPDSLGFMNPSLNLNLSLTHPLGKPGSVAIFCQSGLLGASLVEALQATELGVSVMVHTGLETQTQLADFIRWAGTDPRTQVIAVEVEALKDPSTFWSAVRAANQRKPVVILKAGRSPHGASDRLASFKWGTTAGHDQAFQQICFDLGIIRVHTLESWVVSVTALATHALPRGPRLAIISNDTAQAGLAAQATGETVRLEVLSPTTSLRLRETVTGTQIPLNPVVLGSMAQVEAYEKALDSVLTDPNIDGVLVIVAPSPFTPVHHVIKPLMAVAKTATKPVLTAWIHPKHAAKAKSLIADDPEAPVSAFTNSMHAIEAFRVLALRRQWREKRRSSPNTLWPTITGDELALCRAAWDKDTRPLSLALDDAPYVAQALHLGPSRRQVVSSLSDFESLQYPVIVAPNQDVEPIFPIPLSWGPPWRDHETLVKTWEAYVKTPLWVTPWDADRRHVVSLTVKRDPVLGPFLTIHSPVQPSGVPPVWHTIPLAAHFGLNNLRQELDPEHQYWDDEAITALFEVILNLAKLCSLVPCLEQLSLDDLVWEAPQWRAGPGQLFFNDQSVYPDPQTSHLVLASPPWESTYTLHSKDQGPLTLRALMPQDYEAFEAFIKRLSDKTRYLRYHTQQDLSEERILDSVLFDYRRSQAWVGVTDTGLHTHVEWRPTSLDGVAEFGLCIEDAWQGQGLAKPMMRQCEKSAKQFGYHQLVGFVLKGNTIMQGLMQSLGYQLVFDGPIAALDPDTEAWVKLL